MISLCLGEKIGSGSVQLEPHRSSAGWLIWLGGQGGGVASLCKAAILHFSRIFITTTVKRETIWIVNGRKKIRTVNYRRRICA